MKKPKILIGKFQVSSSLITPQQFALELAQVIGEMVNDGEEFLSIMEGVANGISISAQLIKGSDENTTKDQLGHFLEAVASKLTRAGITTRAKDQEEGGEK